MISRKSKEDLLKELEENKTLLGLKAFLEYRRNGVIVKIEKAERGFHFDKKLILSDGSSVIAWI